MAWQGVPKEEVTCCWESRGLGRVVQGVTEVEAEWLHHVAAPMCVMSGPLPEYPARYMPGKDAVVCRQDVEYGRYSLQLPHAIVPHPDQEERIAAFAAALLEGSVLKTFAGAFNFFIIIVFLCTFCGVFRCVCKGAGMRACVQGGRDACVRAFS